MSKPIPTHLGENDTTAAYALTNPYQLYAKDLEQGKRLYLIQCGICHGEKMDGQGPLYTSEKYIAAPANLTGPKYVNFSEWKNLPCDHVWKKYDGLLCWSVRS